MHPPRGGGMSACGARGAGRGARRGDPGRRPRPRSDLGASLPAISCLNDRAAGRGGQVPFQVLGPLLTRPAHLRLPVGLFFFFFFAWGSWGACAG